MTTIRKEVTLAASPGAVWDAFRDYHNVHVRVARGFVVASEKLEERARNVTFANGMVVREDLISADEAQRRLAYTASGGRLAHHNGVFEIHGAPEGAKLVWTLDILPDEFAPLIEGMMEEGCAAMARTFGSPARAV